MVHVLEWDMEDESDEATEAIEQAVDESHIDSETVDEGDSPTLAGGWDLFTQDELVEEEMELTFVDEDEAEEILSEEDEAIGSYSEDVFDAEAPPKMERLELEETGSTKRRGSNRCGCFKRKRSVDRGRTPVYA